MPLLALGLDRTRATTSLSQEVVSLQAHPLDRENLLSKQAKIYSPSFVFISAVWNLDVGKWEKRLFDEVEVAWAHFPFFCQLNFFVCFLILACIYLVIVIRGPLMR